MCKANCAHCVKGKMSGGPLSPLHLACGFLHVGATEQAVKPHPSTYPYDILKGRRLRY